MPTPEAEEIIKAAWTLAVGDAGPLFTVQDQAPRIDALCLQRVSANEEAWRRTVRLEREARAKIEAELHQYRQQGNGGTDL